MKVDFEPPLREVMIIVTQLFDLGPGEPRQYNFTYEFPAIARLASFFSGNTKLARSVGYNIPILPRHRDQRYLGRILLRYKDRHHGATFEFDDVHHFTKFLKDNPEFAKAVGYVPK